MLKLMLWVAAGLPLAGCADDGPCEPVTEVSVSRTPGKPMQLFDSAKPAEEIVAVRREGKRLLLVRVNVPRAAVKKYTEVSAELTEAEWDGSVGIVDEWKLRSWKPGRAGKAFDFGEAGVSVASKATNVHRWTGPIDNAEGPSALRKRLASLAKNKAGTLTLYYLTP